MLIAAAVSAGKDKLEVSPLKTSQLNHSRGSLRRGLILQAIDYMDDGSPIQLSVKIDRLTGDAVFDFTGTGPEVRGNWNAPISVVHSAIIYWSVGADALEAGGQKSL